MSYISLPKKEEVRYSIFKNNCLYILYLFPVWTNYVLIFLQKELFNFDICFAVLKISRSSKFVTDEIHLAAD